MRIVFYIGCAGFLGAVSRYAIGGLVYRYAGSALPYGTLAVNLIGSLLLGFLMEFTLRSALIPGELRMAVGVGFLGAFTTFSTFSYETFRLFEEGSFTLGTFNIVSNLFICLVAVWIGIVIARAV
ncbi:MAG: fluoride efflux transporter CrcB [Thermodesulfobacteriota bacterium]